MPRAGWPTALGNTTTQHDEGTTDSYGPSAAIVDAGKHPDVLLG